MYYINIFFLYSILGHIMESIVYLFCKGESGILFFPWTPIYGIGVVIVVLCYQKIKQIKNKFFRYLCVFLVGFLLLSLLEFIGGILIEKLFHIVFWSYDHFKFHFGHYIALEISLIWGICSIIIVLTLPFVDKIVKKIPRSITWLFIILIILDSIMTILFR